MVMGLFYVHPPRPPQIKRARCPKTDLVSRENLLEISTLRITLRGGVRVLSGRAVVCVCMKPRRRGECSGTFHWPVGRDSVTGQDAFEYAGPIRDE